nr:hypothetical protein Iba_chr09aCG8990 [Ipomoea batatas]
MILVDSAKSCDSVLRVAQLGIYTGWITRFQPTLMKALFSIQDKAAIKFRDDYGKSNDKLSVGSAIVPRAGKIGGTGNRFAHYANAAEGLSFWYWAVLGFEQVRF